jgi:hypothetical protein
VFEQRTEPCLTGSECGERCFAFAHVTNVENNPADRRLVEHEGRAYALAKSESIEARRFLPGFDEPGFKAVFEMSITVPDGVVFLVDQAELVQGYGDSPAIDMSNQATLHMEDTTPLPLVTGAQGSGVAASPMRSLFQTDSLGLRLVWDITWNSRRTGAVQFKTGVAW